MLKFPSIEFSELFNRLAGKTRLPLVGRPSSVAGCRLSVFAFIIFLSSCGTTRNTTYFQNLQKDTTLRNLVSKNVEAKIQKTDLLGITVASLSPENTAIYNAPQN